jgi:hypothetical protein
MRGAAVGLVLVVLASGCGSADDGDSGSESTALTGAHAVCAPRLADDMEEKFDNVPEVSEVMRLEKDGAELKISIPDGRGDVVAGVLFDATGCVLEETDAPADLVERFNASSPSGGRADKYGDIDFTWYLGGQSYDRAFQSEFKEG